MWQESRKWMATLGFAFVTAILGCSVTHAQDVRYNYRQGADFSKYRTYKWVHGIGGAPAIGGKLDDILDSEIKQSIVVLPAQIRLPHSV